MTDEILRQAIAAIKSGDKALGKKLLVQVLEQDSRNEHAWLWLSACVTSNEQKLDCIKRALEINPNNSMAQKELARLQTLSQIKAQPVTSKPNQNKAKSSNLLPYILITAIVIGCVCIFAIASLSGSGGGDTSGGDTTNGGGSSAWVPSGFERWDNETAIRFAEGKACSYSTVEVCAHYEVFTRYGCPTSLYVEVAFMNSSGTQVDWSNDTATSLSPGTKALLEFISFDSSATNVKVTKIICY